ncbi:MAG: hypothetical protein IAE67_00345 [Candidatus Competibacteraceae bacterium]|nr:hypothetical protein [Candidatus Competibacteraceae bacterium]
MKKTFIIVLILSVSGVYTYSQHTHMYYNPFDYNQAEAGLNNLDVSFHTAVKPWRIGEIKQHLDYDSLRYIPNYNSKFARSFVGRRLFSEDLLYLETKHVQLYANPAFNFQLGRNFLPGQLTYFNTRGFHARGNITKMLSFYTEFYENQAAFADYITDFIDSNRVIPGQGRTKQFKEASYDYAFAGGYINFTPVKYISFELGHGKHFIGDGYRSLLLSDNSFNYPYFKISTQVWKIKYVNIWAEFQDNTPSVNADNLNYKKYGTFHYLSIQPVRYLTLGFFESIIWSGSDSTGNTRGFDVNYINPIIFYRPIEYGLGSADNALMGFTLQIRPHDNHQIYAQILLDEFLLQYVLGNPQKGWRANKQGFQIGYKYFHMFGLRNLNFQTEFNYVRPYTYQHYRINSNYGHYNQALAHPLGANFWEAIGILRYQNKRITAEARLSYAQHGTDTGGVNYGGNVFVQDINHPNEFGNYVGQGMKEQIWFGELRGGYIINPTYDLRVEMGMQFRSLSSAIRDDQTFVIYFGLRTRIPNFYMDY